MKVIEVEKFINGIRCMDLGYMSHKEVVICLEDLIQKESVYLQEESKEVICKSVDKGMDVSGEYNIESNMHCPNCNQVVGDYECGELWGKYCSECGQKLKYTEIEE